MRRFDAIVIGGGLVGTAIGYGLARAGLSLALVDEGPVDTVIIAKLDRLTRSVIDLAELLKRFERRRVVGTRLVAR